MPDTSPRKEKLTADTDTVALTADASTPIAEAPYAGTVTSATYTPSAAITGNTTETRSIAIINKGATGVGTTSVAALAFTTGVNAAASDEKALTLSATAANRVVAAGDILTFTSTHGGTTGLGDPGGLVQVEITRS